MNVDESFAKVLGRQPSDAERDRLYRVRDALGLRDNDAFWYILMVLEHYDSLYREYPKLIAAEAREAVEHARGAFAAAAQAESAKAQRLLSEKVAETGVAIARKLADRPMGLHRVTAALSMLVLFGALCTHAGGVLASRGGQPPWSSPWAYENAGAALAGVLRAPAGWMVFALLLPTAAHGIRIGGQLARSADADAVHRAVGWALSASCLAALAASALLLARWLA